MKTKHKTKTAPGGNLPGITLESAEKTFRDILKREGLVLRKRRSIKLKEAFGELGYGVIDPQRNVLLSGGTTSDGCDMDLGELAEFCWNLGNTASETKNTPWQNTVIECVRQGKLN